MVQFVFFLDPAQDADRIFDRWLRHHHRLEAAGKGCVLFHIFAVLIQRGGTYAVQLTPRQRWLDQIGRIHRAIGFACADKGVHLVDEQDDLAIGRGHFGQNGFQTLFKIAPIFRARDQRAHVQGKQLFVAQGFGHVATDDAQGKALGNRGFTDARFPNQNGVVLGAAA